MISPLDEVVDVPEIFIVSGDQGSVTLPSYLADAPFLDSHLGAEIKELFEIMIIIKQVKHNKNNHHSHNSAYKELIAKFQDPSPRINENMRVYCK